MREPYHDFAQALTGQVVSHFFCEVMQGFLLEADCLPIVQKCGAYFSVKLDRSVVPIENIEHNSEAVSFFHYSGNTRQQHPTNTLPTKPWSDKEVFQENTRALKGRIVVEEESVARR